MKLVKGCFVFLSLLAFSVVPVGSAEAAYKLGDPCHILGETRLDDDRTITIGCFKPKSTQADCGSEASPKCLYKQMAQPADMVKISFELVGGGGGGGGSDWLTYGGVGGSASVLRFSTFLPKGKQINLSVGSGGVGGLSNTIGSSGGDGGSGLMAFGGHGGGTDGSNTPQVGPSGVGGGGGSGTVVMGEGIFAVAGGGGGGGGGSYSVPGAAGNTSGSAGAQGMNGRDGLTGCEGRDGGGGGGGGGGYPAGNGGRGGCDYTLSAGAGQLGGSYYYLSNLYHNNAYPDNYAGAGYGGVAGYTNGATKTHGGTGGCGRITIWSSTGTKYQFDCGATQPFWIVE